MKRLLTILAISCAAATSITLVGCAKDTVKPQLVDPKSNGQKGIEILGFQAQYQGNVLKVQTELKNTNKKNARVYYRFRWLNGQGAVINTEQQWKPVLLYGKKSEIIVGTAPTPDASDYRFEMNVEYPIN